MRSPLDRTILALDNFSKEEIVAILNGHCNQVPMIKIGLELFLRYGPGIVTEFADKFHKEIFLDLKLHDIPNTVVKSIRSLKGLPITFLTIHLSGGMEMARSALLEARNSLPRTKILGVTYLTSLSEEDISQIYGANDKEIGLKKMLTIAKEGQLDGIILSPHELPATLLFERDEGCNFIKITPGIRFEHEIKSGHTNDQKRVMTPHEAITRGANYLVIGRSLTDPTNGPKNLLALKAD